MGNYAGANNYPDNIYQFEQTDLVQGGPSGIDNVPLKQLADRTEFLRLAHRGYFGLTVANATKALTLEEVNNRAVLITGSSTFVISLPTIDAALAGMKITFISQNTKQVIINVAVKIYSEAAKTSVVIAEGEKIELIYDGSDFHLLDHSSNILNVGDFGYGYRLKKNAVIANGALLLRAEYPRLFEYVQLLQGQNSVVSETAWNTQPGNKGFFTLGTNNTNFRVPDLRSMFIRGLDLGAGITFARQSENPGGYEADEFRSHAHDYSDDPLPRPGSGTANNAYPDTNSKQQKKTSYVGGAETRPKNIGLIPYLLV